MKVASCSHAKPLRCSFPAHLLLLYSNSKLCPSYHSSLCKDNFCFLIRVMEKDWLFKCRQQGITCTELFPRPRRSFLNTLLLQLLFSLLILHQEATVPNLDSKGIIILNVYLVCLLHENFNEGMVLQKG